MSSIKIGMVDKKGLKENSKEGIIPFVLTTKSIDRDSEVVLPNGAIVDSFKENPVFVWVHDIKNKAPIGKLLPDTFQITEEYFKSDVQFDLDDPFAKMVYNKYLNGFMNAGSIRFMPKDIGDPILEGQKGATIKTWELLEFSAVPVPANPQALAERSKSIIDDIEALDIEQELINEITKYVSKDVWLKEMSVDEFQPSTRVKEIEYRNDGDIAENFTPIISKSFAVINEYEKDVPEDAILLECPDMTEVPHPHAGKTITMKEIIFVPPLKTVDDTFYWLSAWKDNIGTDIEMIEKLISKDGCKLSSEIASLSKAEKAEKQMTKLGFDSFMIQGAFSDKTLMSISKGIKNVKVEKQISEPMEFDEAARRMVKLLSNDEDFVTALKKTYYLTLCEAYEKEGKEPPSFREGDFKKLNPKDTDPMEELEKNKEVIIEAVMQLVVDKLQKDDN